MNISVFRPFKTGHSCKCQTEECSCPDQWRRPEYAVKFRYLGKQVMRTTGLTVRREAESRGAAIAREFAAGNGDAMMQALNAVARRKTMATIGEALRAYEAEDLVLIKDHKQRRKNVLGLYRVVATGLGMWRKNVAGPTRVNGVQIGGDVPDQGRIDGLHLTVLDDRMVMEYLRNSSAGGVADFSTARPENTTINSVLNQARCVFSRRTVALKMKHLNLPPMDKFLKHPGLPEASVVPEPVRGDEFAAMLAAAEALPVGDVRRTINLILRQTGMRSGSLVHLHRDWMEQFPDGWVMHLRRVKGGTAEYSVPVTEEVAQAVLGSDGYTLPGDEAARARAVQAHSAWVKTVIGETASRSEQGNHRLRDTAASIAFSWLGRDAAVEMLGNGREVNKKHYARLRIPVTDAMRHELRAALRLTQPGNVVPMARVA